MNNLVLSIFPGIDLLGRAFELEGYCVVRGPDLIWGQDVRDFHPPAGIFAGVIGGPPCQDFSDANWDPAPADYGLRMLDEFTRVITEAQPEWWLMENVRNVPDVTIPGYTVQRIPLTAAECGARQLRLRHFQFGSRSGWKLQPFRVCPDYHTLQPAALASEGNKRGVGLRRAWPDFCELQGLPRTYRLDGWSLAFKYAAVGNGVPLQMGRVIARAVTEAPSLAARDLFGALDDSHLCPCNCGRRLTGKQRAATVSCRKRLQYTREGRRPGQSRRDSVGAITADKIT